MSIRSGIRTTKGRSSRATLSGAARRSRGLIVDLNPQGTCSVTQGSVNHRNFERILRSWVTTSAPV